MVVILKIIIWKRFFIKTKKNNKLKKIKNKLHFIWHMKSITCWYTFIWSSIKMPNTVSLMMAGTNGRWRNFICASSMVPEKWWGLVSHSHRCMWQSYLKICFECPCEINMLCYTMIHNLNKIIEKPLIFIFPAL